MFYFWGTGILIGFVSQTESILGIELFVWEIDMPFIDLSRLKMDVYHGTMRNG